MLCDTQPYGNRRKQRSIFEQIKLISLYMFNYVYIVILGVLLINHNLNDTPVAFYLTPLFYVFAVLTIWALIMTSLNPGYFGGSADSVINNCNQSPLLCDTISPRTRYKMNPKVREKYEKLKERDW